MTDKPRKPNPALEKKVRKAITDLQAKGQKPTNSAVQEITGGSFRDISPIVKIVLAEQKAAAAAARAAPDMPEAVFDHATSLWEAAWQAADESAAAERRAHAAELAERDDERADLLESIGIVEDQRDTAETHAKLADERIARQSGLDQRDNQDENPWPRRLEFGRLRCRGQGLCCR